MKSFHWGKFIVISLLAIYAGVVFPQSTYSVLVDTDNNLATGCSVLLPTSSQTINGIERRLIATVSNTPEQVTAVSIEACNGSVLGASQAVAGNFPYAVGTDPVDNSSVVEFAIASGAIASSGDTLRLFFAKQTATADDLLDLNQAGGTPILFRLGNTTPPPAVIPSKPIPTMDVWGFFLLQILLIGAVFRWYRTHGMRFVVMACLCCTLSIAMAAGFVTDGQIGDWFGESPAGIDPVGDVSADADLFDCYIAEENATLFFRCDATNAASGQDIPPVAVADTATLLEDAVATTINVLSNDTDTDAGPKTINTITQPANGVVVITNSGADLSYQPNANFCNNGVPTDDFSYTLTPGSSTTTVSVTVTCINDQPVASNDIAAVAEDAPATAINVLANDSFAPDMGETLTITAVTQGANGTVAITGAGSGLSYTPNANFNGGDSFTYTISDGNGGTATATVNVTVSNANDNPVAMNDSATIDEDSGANTINVLLNDSDPEGNSITITSVSQGSNGSVVITGVGSGLSYAPNTNFQGADSFTYSIIDGQGGGATATVTVTVNNFNDNPDAIDDTPTVDEDSGANAIDVLSNDSDAPDTGETLTITAITQGSNGAVTITGAGTGLSYTPDADFNGADNFTYTIRDGNGGSDTATVSVTITSVNDDPTATDDMATVTEDSAATPIPVLTNDNFAPDAGETLSISGITQGTDGAVVITGGGSGLTYMPNADFHGADSFTYTLSDGNGGNDTATVSVTVTPINDGPGANVQMLMVNEDATLPITLTGSDIDANNLTFTTTVVPSNGSLSAIIDQPNTGTTDSATLTYTPDANFNGPDSFTFQVDDGNGGNNTAIISITVNPQQDTPTANAMMLMVNEDVALPITLTGSDVDSDDMTFTITAQPPNGALSVIVDQANTGTTDSATLTYTPDANFAGADSFTFQIDDGNGNTNTAVVNITINPINDAPIIDAISDPAAILENAAQQTINLSGIAADTNETQILTVTATSSNSALIPDPTVTYTSPNATGSLQYTPVADQSGTAIITVTVQDDGGTANGGVDTTTEQFTVTVTAVNDAPTITAISDPADLLENAGQQSINLSGIAAGTNETQNLTVTATSSNTALIPNPSVTYTTPAATGSLAYTPVANQSGTAIITVTVKDDGGTANGGIDTTTRTFNVTVNTINKAPTINTITNPATINEDAAQQTVNLSGISAGVGETQTLIVTAISSNTALIPNPSVTYTTPAAIGSLTYTPVSNQNGTAVITVTVKDNGGTANGGVDTTTRMFTVNVSAINDVPVVTAPGPFSSNANLRMTIADGVSDLLASANDTSDGGSSTITVSQSSITTTKNGTVTVNQNNGSFTYDPPAGFTGADTFNYTVVDNGVGTPATQTSAAVTVTVNVHGTNQSTAVGAPVIWFIDNSSGGTNVGTLENPFKSIAAYEAARVATTIQAGDFVYLEQTVTNYTGPFNMVNTMTLIGEGASATMETITSIPTLASNNFPLPATNGINPIIGSAANGINLASGNTIRGLTIGAAPSANASLNGTGFGTLTVSEVTINNTSTGEAIDLENGTAAITFDSVIANPTSTRSGIELDTITGSFTVTAGNITKSGSGGAAVDIGGNTNGSGGNATVAIGATLNNSGSGRSVLIQELSGGSVALSGNINDTGAGLSIQGINNGTTATVTLSGASKIFNTGTATAVNLGSSAGNANGTINFTGSGLDIDTTTGAGFVARNGGVINVQGAGNSLLTTTGTALEINNTSIGANGIMFASLGVDGATTGILLDSVSTTGGAINTGVTNLQNVTSRGVDIIGTLSTAILFTDIDIALNNTTAIAFDMNGAIINANVTANDFDITNNAAAGITIGIDLAGTTGTGTVQLGDTTANGGADASIIGVNSGVQFSSATNLTATFGDGDGVVPDGTMSSINATTPITTINTLPITGTYDFEDVAFTGNISNISGPSIFVFDNLATAGAGTFADPGTSTQAEAAMVNVLVMIDSTTGGVANDILLGSDTLSLDDGQALIGLTSGASFDAATIGIAGGGAPASIKLTGLGAGSTITAPAAGIDTVLPSLIANSGTITVDITASAGIANVFITNAGNADDTVRVATSSAGPHNVIIRSATIDNGEDSLLFETTGSSNTTLVLDNVTFVRSTSDLFEARVGGTSTQNITVQNSTIANSNANSSGGGITLTTLAGVGAFSHTYDFDNNDFSGAISNAITANFLNGSSTITGTINNNRIGTTGVAGSGSVGGSGIVVGTDTANVTQNTSITNNTVLGVDGFASIDIVHNSNLDGSYTITGNTVEEMSGFAFAALNTILNGGGISTTGILTLDIQNNTFDASGAPFGGSAVFLDHINAGGNYSLPLYSGSPNGEFAFNCAAGTASADVNTYLTGRGNTLTDGVFPGFSGADASIACGISN